MMLCLMPSEAGFVACAWHHVVCWEAAGWRPLIAVPPVEAAARLVGGSLEARPLQPSRPPDRLLLGAVGEGVLLSCRSWVELSPNLCTLWPPPSSLSPEAAWSLQHQLLLAALTFDFRTPCICLLSFYSFKILSLGACYCRYSLPFPDDSKFQLFCCKFEPNFGCCWITGNCCTIPFFYSGAPARCLL